MKLFTRLFLILGITLTGWSSVAWGYTNYCDPIGGTYHYTYDFGSINVTDPNANTAGTSFPDVYTWNGSGGYKAVCDCDPSNTVSAPIYYSAVSDLPVGHTDGSLQYYKLNEYLEVAAKAWIGGSVQQYLGVPFTGVSNKYKESCSAASGGTEGWASGGRGKLSLYIEKPFIGVVTISSTKIFELYGSWSTAPYGGTPLSDVYISGQVIVPQTCSVNAGQIVTVDFGSFMSGEFKNKGQMPAGYTPKTITVPIKCNGMDANASLTLRFQAEASADEPAAIKTSNDDVGVQITDSSGKVIEPNSGLIPFQLDDNLQATVTFHAAPISTTGNAPAEGTFSATAYIRVDFA